MVSGREPGPNAERVLADWSIRRQVDVVPDARRTVREIAEKVLGPGTQADDIEICVSELLANAIRHGRGDLVHIYVRASGDVLSVRVTDDGSGDLPVPASDASESGRGLLILDALADRWRHSVHPTTGSLSVEFSFDVRRLCGDG